MFAVVASQDSPPQTNSDEGGSPGARKRANYKKLAEALDEAARNGNPVRDVLLVNGYSQAVSNQGWAAVPNRALKLMKGHSKGRRFGELGKSLPAAEQANLVRGALYSQHPGRRIQGDPVDQGIGQHAGTFDVHTRRAGWRAVSVRKPCETLT